VVGGVYTVPCPASTCAASFQCVGRFHMLEQRECRCRPIMTHDVQRCESCELAGLIDGNRYSAEGDGRTEETKQHQTTSRLCSE
jgi:hypothetical protein